MHYLFFDAAGDPGLNRYPDEKKNASPRPFYVQCLISTSDKEAINQKMSDLRKVFKFKIDYEFKYSNYLDQSKREAFFQAIAYLDFKAYVGVLDKDNSLMVASLLNLGGNDLTTKLIIPLIVEALPGIVKFSCIIDEAKAGQGISQENEG